MRKELDIALSVTVVSLVLSGCSDIKGAGVSDVPEKAFPSLVYEPTYTEMPPTTTSTPEIIDVSTPTPTPEIDPYLRGDINFGLEGPITINFPEVIKKSVSPNIAVYPDTTILNREGTKKDNELQKIWFDENFHPGQGSIVTDKDNLGNIIIYMHDGY